MMPVISLAGLEWLDHHKIRINDLPYRSIRYRNGDWVIAKRSLDEDYDVHDKPILDTLKWRGEFWLLNQSFGCTRYAETKTGHGKFTIRDATLFDTVINSIANSPCSINDVVKLPEECFAASSNGKVIRARNLSDGSVELLMRIDWMDTSKAWNAEQARE